LFFDVAQALAAPTPARSLRDWVGIEQLTERTNDPSLAERQLAYERLAASGSPQALYRLNTALLRVLPRARHNAAELTGLVEALAEHAKDPETRVSLLRVVLSSVGPQGEPVESELRQMAALAIAARRDAAAVRALRHALLADDESAQFAREALLAHPPLPEAVQHIAPLLARSAMSPAATSKTKTSQTGTAPKAATRANIARQMASLTTSQLIARLSTDPQAAGLAACQLATRDEQAQRTTVEALLRSANRALRVRVALGLGASPRADATGLLLRAYRDPAWQVRWAVLHALGQRRDPPSLRTLRRAATLEPNREARDLARSLLALNVIAPRSACSAQLPLGELDEVETQTAVAAPNDLPEAGSATKDRSNLQP
jgi:hypothetical protein